MPPKFLVKFPERGFPKTFIPKHGGHAGSISDTHLCVMEALNWAHGNLEADASPTCVHGYLRDLFIRLNDTGTYITRRELFKRVHRLLGTQALPMKELTCWASKLRVAVGDFPHTSGSSYWKRVDEVLDDIDSWCAVHNPALAALRANVPPLNSISARRGSILTAINDFSSGKIPQSALRGVAAKKVAHFLSLPTGAAPQKEAQ